MQHQEKILKDFKYLILQKFLLAAQLLQNL